MRLVCECGCIVRGEPDRLVTEAQAHARSVHGIDLDREVILSLASDDELEIDQARGRSVQ